MTRGIAQVHVRKTRGKIVVQGMGTTPKGQRYLKEGIPLEVEKIGDPKFKEEMAAAVTKLLGTPA